jgi:hypothetical protein
MCQDQETSLSWPHRSLIIRAIRDCEANRKERNMNKTNISSTHHDGNLGDE